MQCNYQLYASAGIPRILQGLGVLPAAVRMAQDCLRQRSSAFVVVAINLTDDCSQTQNVIYFGYWPLRLGLGGQA
jgi:hypothetical protein